MNHYTSQGITYMYEITKEGIVLNFAMGDIKGHLEIPSYIDEIPVIKLGDMLFHNNIHIDSLVLPQKLKYIGDMAFYKSRSIKNVSIPKSVETIGTAAFSELIWTKTILFEP